MKKENQQFHCFLNEKTVFCCLQEALRLVDIQYGEEEKRYLAACDILRNETGSTVSPGAEEYIRAKEQAFSSDALFAAWQGFLLNLRIYQNPVNVLLLREDFEDLTQERRMHTLPLSEQAQDIIHRFYRNAPESQRDLTDSIDDYFAYLKTVGYKLAHYIGFLFGNKFFPKVIPGYAADEVCTDRYTRNLREILQMDVNKIRTLI